MHNYDNMDIGINILIKILKIHFQQVFIFKRVCFLKDLLFG